MHPKYIEVPIDHERSFRVTDELVPHFYNPLHYHKELELTYVLLGTGTRFIGDSLEPFGPGELVLVGSNLPHCWHNDPEYFQDDSTLRAQAIVVQFNRQFAGDFIADIPEFRPLKLLIQMAARGIKFGKASTGNVLPKLRQLVCAEGMHSIVLLLEVLEILATSRDRRILSGMDLDNINQDNLARLNAVIQFTIKHIGEKISLDQAAEQAHLSPTAFCRYFKSHTRKTYTRFVNEIRIKNACLMLRDTALTVADIGYRNGFNNQVHFHRMFSKIQGMSPLKYRQMHQLTPFRYVHDG